MAFSDINWSAKQATGANVVSGSGVCKSTSEKEHYVNATTANLVAVARFSGVAITAPNQWGVFAVQYSGEVASTITGLGPGAPGPVIVGATGALIRKTTPIQGDYVVGTCDADGDLTLSSMGGSNGISPPNATYLAQPTWYVDPTNGDDTRDGLVFATSIKTVAELIRRWGPKPAQLTPTGGICTVYIVGDTDPFSANLLCGIATDDASLFITGYAATTQATGALSAATPAAGNAPWTIAAAGVNWTTHIGRRVRITSGANAGQMAWVLKDLGANTARISDPAATNVPPGSNIGDVTVTSGAMTAGDPFVVETMPRLALDSAKLDELQDVDAGPQIAFSDLHIGSSSGALASAFTTSNIKFYQCRFVDTYAAQGPGLQAFLNCGADNGIYGTTGANMWVLGGGATASHEILAYGCNGTAFLLLDQRCVSQGAGVGFYNGVAGSIVMGSMRQYDAAVHVFNNPKGAGTISRASGTIIRRTLFDTSAFLVGSGHAGPGAWCELGGQILADSGTPTPTLTGASGNLMVDATVQAWPASPTLISAAVCGRTTKLQTPTTGQMLGWLAAAAAWAPMLIANLNIDPAAAIDVAKLAAGSNTQILTTVGTAVAWAAAPTSGITQLTSDVLAGPGSGSVAATVVQLTGSGGLVTVPSGTALQFGTIPATSGGVLRFTNNTGLAWRNAGNSANLNGLSYDASNRLGIGDAGAGTTLMQSPTYSFGTIPATTGGVLLFTNNSGLTWRNASNTQNVNGISFNSSDNIAIGDGSFCGTISLQATTAINASFGGTTKAVIEAAHGVGVFGGGGSDYKGHLGPLTGNETTYGALWLLAQATARSSANPILYSDGSSSFLNAPVGGGTCQVTFAGGSSVCTFSSGAIKAGQNIIGNSALSSLWGCHGYATITLASVNYTMSAAEAANNWFHVNGTVGAVNITITIGAPAAGWWKVFYCDASFGAGTCTVQASSGTGINLTRNKMTIVFCDGTNLFGGTTV